MLIVRRQTSGATSRLDSAIAEIAICISGRSVISMSARTTPASLARCSTSATSGQISTRAAAAARSAPRAPPSTISFSPRSSALQLLEAHEQAGEALPRVGLVHRGACGLRHLLDALLEQRVDQQLLVGEAAVDRPDADAGLARDVVVRAAQPALGEHDARRLEDALAVALGVAAQRALGGCLGRGSRSEA